MLTTTGVTKAYKKRKVLSDVSFAMEPGERIALMGPSGSGKSTLLNCISGLDAPDSGSIKFEGVELVQLTPDERTLIRRTKIGSIFQFFHLLPSMTALENVALTLQLNGYSKQDQKNRSLEILHQVGVEDRAEAFPREMSGGEMQRVAIARALVTRPKLILADEPTGNLDAKNGENILDLIESLSESYKTGLILVTHQQETTRICHKTLTMQDGHILSEIMHSNVNSE